MVDKYTVTLTCSCCTVTRRHEPAITMLVVADKMLKNHDMACDKKAGIGYEKEK